MQLPGFQKRSDVSTGNNLTGLHCSWQNRLSVESVQELPTIKTLEDTHRKCPLWFAQQQLSNAKIMNIGGSMGNLNTEYLKKSGQVLSTRWKSTRGFGCSKKIVKRRSFKIVSNAPRAHQKTQPQPLLWCHPAVPRLQNIKTVKTFLLHLCNAILTSTLALARNALVFL